MCGRNNSGQHSPNKQGPERAPFNIHLLRGVAVLSTQYVPGQKTKTIQSKNHQLNEVDETLKNQNAIIESSPQPSTLI
jgi:hypothetical protein